MMPAKRKRASVPKGAAERSSMPHKSGKKSYPAKKGHPAKKGGMKK